MAKFQLREDETLIGKAEMAYSYTTFLFPTVTRGDFYVTDQRVSFYERWTGYVYMELEPADVSGVSGKNAAMVIRDRKGKKYSFSGFTVKKALEWLKDAGVKIG